MERRKFITGLGALVTGSAAAMGTGAFSSVEASRSVSVNTADDASAYLALESGDTDYVSDDSGDGQLTIDLGGPTVSGDGGGEGFNENATTYVHSVITVKNQGNENVGVGFPDGEGGSTSETTLSTSAGDATFSFHGDANLTPGDSVHIDVEVDTSVAGGEDDTLTIAADEEWYSSSQ